MDDITPRPELAYEPSTRVAQDSDRIVGPLRVRAVEHVGFPLWDAEQWLGDAYEWLEQHLGLSRKSYDALARWQAELEEVAEVGPRERAEHRRAGEELAARLDAELAPRFRVVLAD